MEQSPRLSLSYVAPSQAQKHVTVNETFRRLDALVQAVVRSRTTTAEPASPAEGDAYIIPASATGAVWDAFDEGDLAAYQDGAWAQIPPFEGLRAWVADDDELAVYDGAAWGAVSGGGSSETAAKFGVNATADATNKLAVKSDAVLFSHDDVTPGSGDAQVKVNKAATGDTASHLFQTNFSGRAEFGLTGDDDFHVKVSADGSAWMEALVIDKDTGFLGLLGAPSAQLHVHGEDAELRLEDTANSYLQILDKSATQAQFIKICESGNTIMDFTPDVQDGTSDGLFRFFRTTDTTGSVRFDVHKGDNTAAANCRFYGSGGDSYVAGDNGNFGVGETSPSALFHVDGGGALFGNPAGGDKGTGTVNAEGVYDNNTLLSCYVFDQALDGAVSMEKWDARAPDKIVGAEFEDVEDPETGAVRRAVKTPERIITRTHEPARKFAARIGGKHDPLTLDGYARHWKEKRHLTAMPNEATFDPVNGQLTAGEWVQRLVETVEIQAVLIEELNQRTKHLAQAGSGARPA